MDPSDAFSPHWPDENGGRLRRMNVARWSVSLIAIVGLLVFTAVAYVPLGFFVRGARAEMQPAARGLEVGATSG